MPEIEQLKRVISLKKSGIPLIKKEIRECQILLALYLLKENLETELSSNNDYNISRKLDCLNFILEN